MMEQPSRAPASRLARVGWLVLLWIGGVAVMGVLAAVVRWLMRMAGLAG